MSLVSLTDYKRAIGETGSTQDAYHQDALDAADAIVIAWTGRDFGSPTSAAEDRDYWYDGSGVLNIDDAAAVNSVTLGTGSALSEGVWRAMREGPQTVTVYTYLLLPVIDWRPHTGFGEMGFTQNLDRFIAAPGNFRDIIATVNGEFGFPTIPDDVARAIIWTASSLEEVGGGGAPGELASKSVAEVAESYFAASEATESQEPLPARAAAVLDPYRIRG
jgi:hypothetical protein